MEHLETVPIVPCSKIASEDFDTVVVIAENVDSITDDFLPVKSCLDNYFKIIKPESAGTHIVFCDKIPSAKLILSLTGPLNRDYDDVRRVIEAARDGISTAIKSGSTKPLLAMGHLKTLQNMDVPWNNPNSICLSALLGALYTLYVPLEVREFSEVPRLESMKCVKAKKAVQLGWLNVSKYKTHPDLLHMAWCLEEGRRVSRDIGGSDPERMCASRIVEYMREELKNGVQMDAQHVDSKLYPLAAVVDRGSHPRHKGFIVHLEYKGSDTSASAADDIIDLFMIGKGIVYDTGGSDLKVGGNMKTMHRDKCGAAAVAGFFKTLSLLKPKRINVHGSLAVIRNAIGDNAYVSDEIITSRAGVRVRVNNTDAEGRMVMTDLLCEAKEKALKVRNPLLMTVATLTGHMVLTVGLNYTGVMCNGPARKNKLDHIFQDAGAFLGEMNEISTIRREDFDTHHSLEEYCDLNNAARPVGGQRHRGHQSPPAFMIMASGLDSHMNSSEHPLPYVHFDIAGSQGPCPGSPSAVPILTWSSQYLLQDLWK